MSETTKDTLRPETWNEYIGQTKLKEQLNRDIEATLAADKLRGSGFPAMLPHILLAASPGVGKTSLCKIIAGQMKDLVEIHTMPKHKDFFVNKLIYDQNFPSGILVLDEIHRMTSAQQQDLLSILENGIISTPKATYEIPPCYTIIGTTTRKDLLDPALLNGRFPIMPHFVGYTEDEMAAIIRQMAAKIEDCELELAPEQCTALAKATGGVPRNARRLVLAARSVKLTGGKLDSKNILSQAGLDEDGLTGEQLEYLKALFRFKGNAGLDKLANILFLNPNVVKEMERMLYDQEFIDYADKGRVLTAKGRAKIAGKSQGRGR